MTSVDYVHDPDRLQSVSETVLDEGSRRIDGIGRLTRIARTVLGVPTAFLTVLTDDRQIFLDHLGLPPDWADAGETPLSHSYCQMVVNGRTTVLVSDAHNDERVRDNPATGEANIGAYAGVPVRAPDGHVLGSFCALDNAPREWSERDVRVLEDLASAVETHLILHTTRSELNDQLVAAKLDRALENSMVRFATATNFTSSVADLIEAVLEHGQEAIGAKVVTVAILEGGQLRFVHGGGITRSVASTWPTAPLDSPIPMAVAMRDDERIVLANPDQLAEWPAIADSVADLGIRAFAAIPIPTGTPDAKAVVGIGWADPLKRSGMPPAVDRLVSITRQGLEQAFSHERAREHAQMLESIVLPAELPIVPGLESAGLYLPPTHGQRVGGDVYDVVVRDDGLIGLVIADAAGHTISSSKAVTRVRHAMGVLTLEGRNPADILRTVNAYLSRSFVTTLVTACYVLVDVNRSLLTISNAGHPQPLQLTAAGEITPVGPIGEQLLGVSPFDYSEFDLPFMPGDSILMFTDGLIERRSRSLDEGERWLHDTLARFADRTPQEVAELVESSLPAEREDDIALLYVRRSDNGGGEGTVEFEWEGPARSVELADMRRRVEPTLELLVDERRDDVLLVVTELITNAVEASATPDDPVTLSITSIGDGVEVRVSNRGESFVAMPTMPGSRESHGRGLAIASTVSELSVHSSGRTVVVTARFAGL